MKMEFSQHSGTYSLSDFKYDDDDDHYIEAARVALGRLLEIRGGVELTRASEQAKERLTLPRELRER